MKGSFFLLLLLGNICLSQPEAILKIASNVSTESLKKNLYYLASDQMEGRLMGSHGDTLASLFVAKWFKKNKLEAPYDHGRDYFQAISADKVVATGSLTIYGVATPWLDNWVEFSPWREHFLSVKNAGILLPYYDDPDSLDSALSKVNCKGKAIIFPLTISNKMINEEVYARFLLKLGSRGIVAVIEHSAWITKFIEREKKNFLPHYTSMLNPDISHSSVLGLGLTEGKINELLSVDHLDINKIDEEIARKASHEILELNVKLSAEVKKSVQKIYAPNVIGILKGTDSGADCIVVSAHHDHDGRNGKDIYYGAVDNGSGTVAIMEMAAMMNTALLQGLRPKRTIVFASFTGEERGLLGSSYYVKHPVYPVNKTHAVMNIDMFGRVDTFYSGKRPDSNYVYILVKDSLNRGLRKALFKANETVHLKLDPYYEQPQYMQRRLTGSDQYPFYLKGVPFIRIDCGFCRDYHKPTDTPDKINYDLLTNQTRLAFLTLWNIANE